LGGETKKNYQASFFPEDHSVSGELLPISNRLIVHQQSQTPFLAACISLAGERAMVSELAFFVYFTDAQVTF